MIVNYSVLQTDFQRFDWECSRRLFINTHLFPRHLKSLQNCWAEVESENCGLKFTESRAQYITFMHLADAFIQRDLQCIQATHFVSVCVLPGNWTHNLLRCWRNALPLSHRNTVQITTISVIGRYYMFWVFCCCWNQSTLVVCCLIWYIISFFFIHFVEFLFRRLLIHIFKNIIIKLNIIIIQNIRKTLLNVIFSKYLYLMLHNELDTDLCITQLKTK